MGWPSAIFDGNETIYIFNSDEQDHDAPGVVAWNTKTETGTILDGDVPIMPSVIGAVWDGRYAYLLGAGEYNSPLPGDGIYQYDPIARTATFLQVANYPGQTGRGFGGMGVAYVAKLNRISYIGGATGVGSPIYWDNIGYIDLTPVNGKVIEVEI